MVKHSFQIENMTVRKNVGMYRKQICQTDLNRMSEYLPEYARMLEILPKTSKQYDYICQIDMGGAAITWLLSARLHRHGNGSSLLSLRRTPDLDVQLG